jgi:hypothetical protein
MSQSDEKYIFYNRPKDVFNFSSTLLKHKDTAITLENMKLFQSLLLFVHTFSPNNLLLIFISIFMYRNHVLGLKNNFLANVEISNSF